MPDQVRHDELESNEPLSADPTARLRVRRGNGASGDDPGVEADSAPSSARFSIVAANTCSRTRFPDARWAGGRFRQECRGARADALAGLRLRRGWDADAAGAGGQS